MLFLKGLCRARLRFQIRVDLRLVGVVVGESGMNLRE